MLAKLRKLSDPSSSNVTGSSQPDTPNCSSRTNKQINRSSLLCGAMVLSFMDVQPTHIWKNYKVRSLVSSPNIWCAHLCNKPYILER